jgi:CO/xanthine dehydrogenase Mo-binding subunit
MAWSALNIADPETPVGARGIGEPPVAAGCCAVLNAISNALGDDVFKRAPVHVGPLLAALDAGHAVQEPLTAHI